MGRRNLYISKLPYKTTWECVQKTFNQFGEIDHIRYRDSNQRGLVKFFDPQDALKACKHFQQNKFLGHQINVAFDCSTWVQKESTHEEYDIRVKELDDTVAKEKEILEMLRTSWDNFCSTVPQSQENLTFDEIVQCLDKVPYEMAQPWKHSSFQEEIQKMSNSKEIAD